jgi:hypothetical protein
MEKVLLAYENALKKVKGLEIQSAYDYLWSKDLEFGICFYCYKKKIEFKHKAGPFIFQTPNSCHTIEEIIKSLEFRINFLKKYIEDEKI